MGEFILWLNFVASLIDRFDELQVRNALSLSPSLGKSNLWGEIDVGKIATAFSYLIYRFFFFFCEILLLAN